MWRINWCYSLLLNFLINCLPNILELVIVYRFLEHCSACLRQDYTSCPGAMAETFSLEDQLPNLSVPKLEITIERYLYSIKAVASEEQYNNTKRICLEFLKHKGPELQSKLKEREKVHKNWLEELWLDHGYLELRLPLPYMNFAGTASYHEQFWPRKEGTQIERAAFDLHVLGKFWKVLRNEEVDPHKNSKGHHFSMHQFRTIFNTCRIPHHKRDELRSYFKTTIEGDAPSHAIILCKGRLFKINLLSSITGELYTPPQFAKVLHSILQKCAEPSAKAPGVAALTSLDRDAWADAREHMIAISSENERRLREIESAIHVSSLDDHDTKDFDELLFAGLTGDPSQRWRDKSYNSIWSWCGIFSASADHAAVDGMVVVMFHYFTTMILQQCDGKWTGSMDTDDVSTVEELIFDLDDRLLDAIEKGKAVGQQFNNDTLLQCQVYKGIGKVDLKSIQVFPDAFVQICLQLTYMRLHGKPAPTYETATTRKFYHGRTETCRTCIPEIVKFCRAFFDNKPKAEVGELLQDAYDKLVVLMRECENNRGCDRNLFGLSLLAAKEGGPLPELFTDPMYCKSGGNGNFVLSTSFVGFLHSNGAVTPMVDDGYGAFYRMNDHRIVVTLTTWKHSSVTDINKYRLHLEDAFVEVFKIFKSLKEAGV